MKPLLFLSLAAVAHAATPVSDIKVPPGFKVELLREAGSREGSWISMALDAAGRIYISPQGSIPESGLAKDSKWGGLWRSTVADGKVTAWDKVPVPVGDSMGMLWAFDSLYVSGNGPEGRGIYRCKDTDGDSLPDTAVMWKRVPGGAGEHGAHALVLSPDKTQIYIVHGNSTGLIDGIAPDSPYRNWGEDDLLPKLKDPTATFFDNIKAPYGYVVRTDEHGKKWELMAGGMRNAYDIDFNADGELFTYDSDMEWDRGLPWYRPTRVLHIVPGGEYGFREGSAKMPAYYPDTLPAVVDIGLGCPTGVKFGTLSNFGEKYRRAFFACDWTYGRILAVHITKRGRYTSWNPLKSYSFPKEAESSRQVEPFVVGKGMPVTDVEFLQDGSMVFTTGGRGTSAGLYRVTMIAPPAHDGLPSMMGSGILSGRTRDRSPDAQLKAMLTETRDSSASVQVPILERLKAFPLKFLSDDLKLLKLRILQLTFARHGRPSEEWQKVGLEKLLASYPATLGVPPLGGNDLGSANNSKNVQSIPPKGGTPSVQALNRELSQLLVWLSQLELGDENTAVVPKAKGDKGEKQPDSIKKISVPISDPLDGGLSSLKSHDESSEVRVGLLNEQTGLLDARVDSLGSQVGLLGERVGLLDEHVRLLDEHVGLLDEHVGLLDERVGLLDEHVGLLDERVGLLCEHVGLHPEESQPQSDRKTAPGDPAKNPGAAVHLGRKGAAFHSELGQQVIEKTLALMDAAPSQEEQIHYALVLRWAHGWTPQQRERYFRWFHEKGARLSGGNSLAGFIKKIHTEAAGRVPESERAALAKWLSPLTSPAAEAAKPRAHVKAWTLADLEPALDALKDRAPDLARGKQLYAEAQCSRCHLYKDAGGNVGPDLSAVAQRFQRRDILDAIIEPNKAVSEQYALTTLRVIKFGGGEEDVTGLLAEETSGTIRIITDPLTGASKEFYHNVVKKKEKAAVSLMPPALLNTLSAEEVADLLAFMGAK